MDLVLGDEHLLEVVPHVVGVHISCMGAASARARGQTYRTGRAVPISTCPPARLACRPPGQVHRPLPVPAGHQRVERVDVDGEQRTGRRARLERDAAARPGRAPRRGSAASATASSGPVAPGPSPARRRPSRRAGRRPSRSRSAERARAGRRPARGRLRAPAAGARARTRAVGRVLVVRVLPRVEPRRPARRLGGGPRQRPAAAARTGRAGAASRTATGPRSRGRGPAAPVSAWSSRVCPSSTAAAPSRRPRRPARA